MPDERVVAVVRVGRRELERRLADVLAAARLDEAVEGVVGVAADRLDLLVAVEDGRERGVLDLRDVADRVVGVAQVLDDRRIAGTAASGGGVGSGARRLQASSSRKVSGSYSYVVCAPFP